MVFRPAGLARVIRGLVIVAVCVAALGLAPTARANAPAQPLIGGTFYVNSLADTNAYDSELTLREALLIARGGTGGAGLGGTVSNQEKALLTGCSFTGNDITGGCGQGFADTIVFSYTLGSDFVITLTASLPAITDTAATIIDAFERGAILEAQGLVTNTDVLSVTSNSNQLIGLTITNAPRDALVVTGAYNNIGDQFALINSGRYGLRVDGGDYNQLHDLWVGLRTYGSVGACADGNGGGGILVENGAISNTIESLAVRCNGGFGVSFAGSGTHNNLLRGALITNQGTEGVLLVDGAHHNTIGQPGHLNQITSNGGDGILISVGAHDNNIYSNFIGVAFPGLTAAPNLANGIRLANGAHHNHLGELFSTAERNYISGNAGSGVRLETGATQNLIESNYIGLAANGASAIPNGSNGVTIISADDNNVGSSTAGAAQFIAGNTGAGVYVEDSVSVFIGQTVAIGVGSDYLTPLGNGGTGVWLVNAADTSVLAGLVGYSGGPGLRVTGSSAVGNKLNPYEVRGNAGLPIDLDPLGATANDPADADNGPNHLLNYPVVTSIVGDTVSGTACADCDVLIYQAIGDPSQPGGGARYWTSVTANGAGAWSATVADLTRAEMTFQACAGPCSFTGDTSEFSPRPQILLPLVTR